MTTIIGIKTNSGPLEGIVLAADSFVGLIDKEGELTKRKMSSKIAYGPNWAIAFSGTVNEDVYRFYQIISGSKRYGSSPEKSALMINEVVNRYLRWEKSKEKSYETIFEEINKMNAHMMRKEIYGLDDLPQFIFAVNTEPIGIALFSIDEFGNLKKPEEEKDFEYIALGTGSENAENHIKRLVDEEETIHSLIDIPRAVELAFGALKEAESDVYTGGPFDLVILTKDGIDSHIGEMKEEIQRAREKVIKEIKEKYEPQIETKS